MGLGNFLRRKSSNRCAEHGNPDYEDKHQRLRENTCLICQYSHTGFKQTVMTDEDERIKNVKAIQSTGL